MTHYEHREIGYNYRLSNLLAAVGRAQLIRLEAMVDRRREIRARYRDMIVAVEGIALFGDDNDHREVLNGTCGPCRLTFEDAQSLENHDCEIHHMCQQCLERFSDCRGTLHRKLVLSRLFPKLLRTAIAL